MNMTSTPQVQASAVLPITLEELRQTLPLKGLKVLIVVENLPVPFDRRVWMEARTLAAAGARVSVICPTGKGHEERYWEEDGIRVYRHPLPLDASGAMGYLLEYGASDRGIALDLLPMGRFFIECRGHG